MSSEGFSSISVSPCLAGLNLNWAKSDWVYIVAVYITDDGIDDRFVIRRCCYT